MPFDGEIIPTIQTCTSVPPWQQLFSTWDDVTQVPEVQAPKGVFLKRWERLRAFLAELPEGKFDMRYWSGHHGCCIGGWAEQLFGVADANVPGYLGLARGMAGRMFTPFRYEQGRYSKASALRMIDTYIRTGDVAWV
jgi:hypothetical protein